MKLTSELYDLTLVAAMTAAMWIPYIVAAIVLRGPMRAMANPVPESASATSGIAAPAWMQRAKRAHANAVENLAVFAPLVLVAAFAGISTPATVFAAKLYLIARMVHYVVYVAGIPVVRTLAFLVGFGATVPFVTAILAHAR
ncbi:MAPEG family protein [Pandoraea sp. NPDC087047]|uniref:MAPEG family protein n=1 Tax=Pandoraea sp. NPDC087047 TaxID=3364390 RepID=UPI00381AE6DB